MSKKIITKGVPLNEFSQIGPHPSCTPRFRLMGPGFTYTLRFAQMIMGFIRNVAKQYQTFISDIIISKYFGGVLKNQIVRKD